MLELVNISNLPFEVRQLLGGEKAVLDDFLGRHRLDGLELFLCGPRDEATFPADLIHGVHLRFWPAWVSFWRQDAVKMARDYGGQDAVREMFGGERVEAWLELWRENIREAAGAGAKYLVLHVAETPLSELCARPFTTICDEEVIDATLELVAALSDVIPKDCQLLFENLWWPGLTLRRTDLAERLLSRSKHQNCGFLVDTGHLMCTNLDLVDEADSADFVVAAYRALGSLGKRVYGLHLHQSQSGAYVRTMMNTPGDWRWPRDSAKISEYVARVDAHRPFQTSAVRRIVEAIQPEYLVHEFLPATFAEWEEKVHTQRHALGWE